MKKEKKESPTSFMKSLLGASVSPGAESDLWPPKLSRVVIRTDPVGDHCVGCLGQTHVSLPE